MQDVPNFFCPNCNKMMRVADTVPVVDMHNAVFGCDSCGTNFTATSEAETKAKAEQDAAG